MSAAAASLVLRARVREGVVEHVEIVSPRADPSPLFIGLAPAEAAILAGRLFSLCPAAQSLAALAAGEVAAGVAVDEREIRARGLKLLCERLGEMLRASLLDWPADGAPASDDIAALREALKLLRALPENGGDLFPRLSEVAGALGLGDGSGVFVRQMAEARADSETTQFSAVPLDPLRVEDDPAVWDAMTCDAAFARLPALPGRCPETGAAARQRCAEGGLAARLAARRADMAATLEAIGRVIEGGAAPNGLIAVRGDGAGGGFAAVDSARGRLHHALRLDDAGRIADYHIVAPTEWNFHPQGPFARALLGATIGQGATAKRRVERLAFVFDPCIRAVAEISDQSHA
ncbi:nickel-dependent hydrogenase large subunit [Rhodoblastus sp.]|uniref:nickel-dependent hydrogenase large subunit n=1 Tax=Rhodoblastus sp. TaxID=1962975 RepID=UPI0035ADA1AE